MSTLEYCTQCGLTTEAVLELTPETVHYGKLICAQCGKYHRFISKPDSDTSKYRRPSKHRELVAKYAKGHCEMCLLSREALRPGVTLEAHHVVRFEDGGSHERDNIWILCTSCHRLIHWTRRYTGQETLT